MIARTGHFRALAHGIRRSRRSRGDLVAVAAAGGLVLAAAVVGRRLLADGVTLVLPFPPLLAQWLPHVGPGTPFAVVVAVTVVARGPVWGERLSWRALPPVAAVGAGAWTLSLALVDGWQRGVVDRLTTADEYLHDVPRAPALPVLLREFGAHILTTAVDPAQTWFWTTHVGAHPPGAFLVFVLLDRIGLGGGAAAGLLVIAVGASTAAAILVAARAMGDEPWPAERPRSRCCSRARCGSGCPRTGCSPAAWRGGSRCSRSRCAGPAGGRRSPPRAPGSCWAGPCTCRTGSCSAACSRSPRPEVGARCGAGGAVGDERAVGARARGGGRGGGRGRVHARRVLVARRLRRGPR